MIKTHWRRQVFSLSGGQQAFIGPWENYPLYIPSYSAGQSASDTKVKGENEEGCTA